MLLPTRKKIRRILITILAVLVGHVVLIYGFMSHNTVKPNKNPKLVYTSIVSDPKLAPAVLYIATPNLPCISVQKQSETASAEMPTCTEARQPPAGYEILGAQGFITIKLTRDSEGRVLTPEIIVSSGNPEVDQAAMDQVRDTWIFQPCASADASACEQSINFRWQAVGQEQ